MIQSNLQESSYLKLPSELYSLIQTDPVPQPSWAVFNHDLAHSLGLSGNLDDEDLAILSGNKPPTGLRVLAQAYSGHQFGYFNRLGDGRAAVLGEVIDPNGKVFELQLKGSGPTPYARGGDGKAVLGPMLREHAIGEYLTAFGIRATRALSVVLTGEPIWRQSWRPGAVLCRVAESHLRVGTFEHAASLDNKQLLKCLADYAIERHYPHLVNAKHPYRELLHEVGLAQAKLVAQWMALGFIHGVMNTDNVAISGQSIDFGPCAFMEVYHPAQKFSSIDHEGRYAWGRQATIATWNHARFAESLIPLLHKNESSAVRFAQKAVDHFAQTISLLLRQQLGWKLGINAMHPLDHWLIEELLNWMQKTKQDFTRTFRHLADAVLHDTPPTQSPGESWNQTWRHRLESEPDAAHVIDRANPRRIPRNFLLQQCLDEAEQGNLEPYLGLVQKLKDPWGEDFPEDENLSERDFVTFCGT